MEYADLLPEFLANLANLDIKPQERILVAVSGGLDSMALLHLFLRWNPENVGVFHLNHGFRAEAGEDAKFVESYAKARGVKVHIETYDIPAYLGESGESKQQGARKIRYQLMEECASKYDYNRIALAHHGDDQAETMLMRILRGSGLHGLGGIPDQRGVFVRPLLSVFKEDLADYCQRFQIPFVEDATNFEPIYLRNKVRQELLPHLQSEYNPQIVRQLIQLGELAQADDHELERQVEQICQIQATSKAGQVTFPRKDFEDLSLSLQRRVLRKLIQMHQGHLLRIDFIHIEEWRLQLLNNSSFCLSLPGIVVSATQEQIFVGEFQREVWQAQELVIPGETKIGQVTITAELFSISQVPLATCNFEDFDLDDLVFPLIIRQRRPGDRLQPFGGTGSTKVKDLLIDAHIPREIRDTLPLICDQRGILWIPTVRRSSLGALGKQTTKVLRLSYCHA